MRNPKPIQDPGERSDVFMKAVYEDSREQGRPTYRTPAKSRDEANPRTRSYMRARERESPESDSQKTVPEYICACPKTEVGIEGARALSAEERGRGSMGT